MTAHWMAYCLAVGALLALAAWALEAALRAAGRPTRGVWAAALVLSLALPAGARWMPRTPPAETVVAGPAEFTASTVDVKELFTAAANVPRWELATLDRPLAALWAGASAATLLALLAMGGALHLRRRRWAEETVDGERVLVSASTGPAVVGFVRGRIVLPRWVVEEADTPTRALLLDHEREHLRAGDPRLLALALAAVAALPFSPAAWWMLARLRLAVEVDCDARVLARRADVAAYGRLLLEVGRRRPSAGLPLVAFSTPASYLERRIRIMTARTRRTSRIRAAALAALGIGVAAAACETPGPVNPTPFATEELYAAEGAREGMQPARLTPREAVARYYPDVLTRGAGEGAELVFVVSGGGDVIEHHLTRSASPGTDAGAERSATRTARRMEALGVQPGTIERIDVSRIHAGRMGPDAFSLIWIQQRPEGAAAAGAAVSAPAAAAAPDAPSAEVVREHVVRYLPGVAERGTTASFVYFVVDAGGAVVAHGEGEPGGAELEGRDPSSIAAVHVMKGEHVTINGHEIPVVWVRLKG